jgi:hypothetical protein
VSLSADERRGGRVTVKRVTTAFDRREGRNGGGGVRPSARPSGGGGVPPAMARERQTRAGGRRHAALAEELRARLTGGAAHNAGLWHLLTSRPGRHSTSGGFKRF